MDKNLTLIDADSLCYMCGNTETLSEAVNKIEERIENIISNTKADYISLFISKGKYFRHDILADYKGNRTGEPPKWMRSLKTYLEAEYKANFMQKAEADDLVMYWMNTPIVFTKDGKFMHNKIEVEGVMKYVNITMSAIDKDLIKSIPGKHWNFTFKSTDEAKAKKKINPEYKILDSEIIKGWWEETNEVDAVNFINYQALIGDSGDNILGCAKKVIKEYKTGEKAGCSYEARAGYGPKGAEIYLQSKPNDIPIIQWVISAYLYKFGDINGIYELQKNYRLLYLLKTDEDFLREIGTTPDFPNIIKVKSEEKPSQIDF